MRYQSLSHPLVRAAAAFLLALVPGCGGDIKATPDAAGTGAESSLETQPVSSDPCAWVTAAEVEELVGRLQGTPERISQESGEACLYTLPDSGPKPYTLPGIDPTPEHLTIRVNFEDPLTYESASAMVGQIITQDPAFQSAAAGKPLEETPRPEGWDYFSEGAAGSVFRLGHMAVVIGVNTPRRFTGERQTRIATRLAELVRGRVPDKPVAAGDEYDRPSPVSPCGLVTRSEAEAVMGKLAVDPYRSKRRTPFAMADGSSCAYYGGNHRVLVITPTWSDGRESFGLASGLTDEITSNLGVGEQSAVTLDGPWDQAKADMDGTLNFLAGDRVLEVQYRTSNVEMAGALQLARHALSRMGKQ
jgi:hypothetical protein